MTRPNTGGTGFVLLLSSLWELSCAGSNSEKFAPGVKGGEGMEKKEKTGESKPRTRMAKNSCLSLFGAMACKKSHRCTYYFLSLRVWFLLRQCGSTLLLS